MRFEQIVEQDPERIKWELNKRQNSIKFKTKKDEGSMNGRIGQRQKKMGVE